MMESPAFNMFVLACITFTTAALVPIVSSVWLRPQEPLGKPFWVLTILVVLTAATLLILIFSTQTPQKADPYGYALLGYLAQFLLGVFVGAIGTGWLVGVAVVILIRRLRGKA